VLEGTLRFKLATEIQSAPAGTCAFVPRGAPHTWQNVGEGPARMWSVRHLPNRILSSRTDSA
jgi:mannose-6-phosphate isomerase-like protein (cupin superfamily)